MVRGFSQQAMQRIVVDLVASRELQQVSAFTSGKLLMRSGITAAYAATARKFIEEKLRKAGFDPAQFLVPLTSEAAQPVFNAGAQILEAIRSLEPVRGAPVSVWRPEHSAGLPESSSRPPQSSAGGAGSFDRWW